jgi:septum site-determining protein MinC
MISIKGLRQGLLIIFSDEHVPWLTKLRELEEKLVAGSSFFQGAQVAFDVRGLELDNENLKRLIDLAGSFSITPFAIICTNENTRAQVEALGLATRLQSPAPVRKPAPRPPIAPVAPAITATPAETVTAVAVINPPEIPATAPGEAPVDVLMDVTPVAAADAPAVAPEPTVAPEDNATVPELETAAIAPAAVDTPADLEPVAPAQAQLAAPIVATATIAAAIADAEENQERGTDGALIKRRVRSGQIVRHPGHVVVVGDVNPGARIEAGGDIIIWGKLQGTAHAGAFGNAKAVICALEMAPNLVKIADLIIRNHRGKAEMAAIKEQEIVFTRWESKS